MTERLRVRDKKDPAKVFTLLAKRLPTKGIVEVRNGHGFREMVPARNLELFSEDEPGAKLRFEQ